jgi:hypothetical protein
MVQGGHRRASGSYTRPQPSSREPARPGSGATETTWPVRQRPRRQGCRRSRAERATRTPPPGGPGRRGGPDPTDGGDRRPRRARAELKFLREEVDLLRRRLETAPTRIRTLEERLLETKGQLQAALAQNAKLTETLRSRPRPAAALKEEVERLAAPPQTYATFLDHDGTTAGPSRCGLGRKLEVNLGPEVDADELARARRSGSTRR